MVLDTVALCENTATIQLPTETSSSEADGNGAFVSHCAHQRCVVVHLKLHVAIVGRNRLDLALLTGACDHSMGSPPPLPPKKATQKGETNERMKMKLLDCLWPFGDHRLYKLNASYLLESAAAEQQNGAMSCGFTGLVTLQGILNSAMNDSSSWLTSQLQANYHPTYYGMMVANITRHFNVSKT